MIWNETELPELMAMESPTLSLQGQTVCAAGRFVTTTQTNLAELVLNAGGRFVPGPSRKTSVMVVGDDSWPVEANGSLSRNIQRALQLIHDGVPLELVSEEEFLGRLGVNMPSPVRGRHSVRDVCRLLDISAPRVRMWIRLGLIEPVETIHRLDFFDYREVANAKRLAELIRGGASTGEIRRGLEQLRGWLPDAHLPFSQLAMLESAGRLLVRLNGELFDPDGQRLFNFDSEASSESVVPLVTGGVPLDELFEAALEAEDAGQYRRAARLYRQAIEIDAENPVLHFNLGNVQFAIGAWAAACDAYREAVSHDPNYVEAWNNLGSALAELGEESDAVAAFRQALRLVPGYADAQYNVEHLTRGS